MMLIHFLLDLFDIAFIGGIIYVVFCLFAILVARLQGKI